MSHIVLRWFNSGYTVIVMRRTPLSLWLSRQAKAFAYLESATLFLEPLVSGRNLVRSPSAERRVRSLLAVEAFNSQNTQDKSVSRSRKATCHPHGVAEEVAGESSHTSWPSDSSGRKKVWNFTSSVFMTVGDADTHPGRLSPFESHVVRQRIHAHASVPGSQIDWEMTLGCFHISVQSVARQCIQVHTSGPEVFRQFPHFSTLNKSGRWFHVKVDLRSCGQYFARG